MANPTAKSKETSAMARARELNRTNERRLSDCIVTMSKDVERNLQKLKLEGETTMKFMKRLKHSSGKSDKSLQPLPNEDEDINLLVNPLPKMSFAIVDYRKKKLQELSQRLTPYSVSPSAEGSSIPVRSVHAWTSSTARVLSQKKPPQVARPTGRRRHSVESDDDSSDSDDFCSLLTVKKKAGQKRLKELAKRRSSLPIILERKGGVNKKLSNMEICKSKNSFLPKPLKKISNLKNNL